MSAKEESVVEGILIESARTSQEAGKDEISVQQLKSIAEGIAHDAIQEFPITVITEAIQG